MEEEKTVNRITYSAAVDPKCEGCKHLHDVPETDMRANQKHCTVFHFPQTKWLHGRTCIMATNLVKEEKKKAFIDPIKASKQMMGKKK